MKNLFKVSDFGTLSKHLHRNSRLNRPFNRVRQPLPLNAAAPPAVI
jgi:hypothetical protein